MTETTHANPPVEQIEINRYKTATQSKINACSDCGSNEFIKDQESGEIICSKCGLVNEEEAVNRGPEWRSFSEEERNRRSRMGPLQSELTTDLGTTFNAYEPGLDPQQRNKYKRLRKWNIRSKLYKSRERNLNIAMNELQYLVAKLNENAYTVEKHVLENAARIYRKVLDKKLVKGRSILGIAAASLHAANRIEDKTIPLKVLAKTAGVEKNDVGRIYRLLLKEGIIDKILPPTTEPYISKLVNNLKLTSDTELLALDLLDCAKELKINSGKDVKSIASAVLYIACVNFNEKKTQKEIADAIDITEVTLRNRYKEFINKYKEFTTQKKDKLKRPYIDEVLKKHYN